MTYVKKSSAFVSCAVIVGMLMSSVTIADEFVVAQRDRQFQVNHHAVEMLTAKVGDTVHFRNDDSFFHNVYSGSDKQPFDLGSYPRGFQRSVTLRHAGELLIECGLHATMKMKVYITN